MAAEAVLYFFVISLLFPLFTLLLCGFVFLQNLHKKYERIPGPKRKSFFWGNAKEFQREIANGKRREEIFCELAKKHGPVFVTWEAHKSVVTISDPELIKNVMTVSNLPKDPKIYENLSNLFGERFLGRGFATESTHNTWVHKKLVIEKGFSKRRLEGLMVKFSCCCDELVGKLSELADGKIRVNIDDELKRLALDVIGKVAFGIDIKSISEPDTPFCTALEECRNATKWAADNHYHRWDITSYEYQGNIKEAVKYMRDFGKKVIDARRAAMEDEEAVPSDVLNSMLKAADGNSDTTLEDLLDDFVSVFFIGQEQISSVLHSILLEISHHPDAQERLSKEFNTILEDGLASTEQDLEKLHYCDLVIKESLRLHPPVAAVSYLTTRGEKVGGHFIPEATKMQALPYILHRDPEIWATPDEFIPERFQEEISALHYIPFGPDMKDCIGNKFVDFHVKIFLSKLLQKFRIRIAPRDDQIDDKKTENPIAEAIKFTLLKLQ